MNHSRSDWNYNVLNIYNFRKSGPYKFVFDFLSENQSYLNGDILEAGAFNGRTALAFALFLKENNLAGHVHAFDTFEGFPEYSEFDLFENFEVLFSSGQIDRFHFDHIKEMEELSKSVFLREMTPATSSSSGNFSNVDLPLLYRKIDLLRLENLTLHKGQFSTTMKSSQLLDLQYSLIFIDCDLYDGYLTTLEYGWKRLKKGGLIFLDEYYSLKFPGARIATNNFLSKIDDNSFELDEVSDAGDDFERWVIRKL